MSSASDSRKSRRRKKRGAKYVPSASYKGELDRLHSALLRCMKLSRDQVGKVPANFRQKQAPTLLLAILDKAITISKIAPYFIPSQHHFGHWDYSSMFAIARTILELRATFHYICIDPCSDDEWTCRWSLLELHDCEARRRFFEASEGSPENLDLFEKMADRLREQLRGNEFFRTLKNQGKLLKGQTAHIHAIEEIFERSGEKKNHFRVFHILFSNHLHGLPMSYFRLDELDDRRESGFPSEKEEIYTGLCLSFVTEQLNNTANELEVLFSKDNN
jgi:hypothetical protein